MAEPRGSAPGFRHPLLVLQADSFNRSRIRTVIGLIVSSNVGLLDSPGNVLLRAGTAGLPRDSVVNVTQFATVDRDYLEVKVGQVPPRLLVVVRGAILLVVGEQLPVSRG